MPRQGPSDAPEQGARNGRGGFASNGDLGAEGRGSLERHNSYGGPSPRGVDRWESVFFCLQKRAGCVYVNCSLIKVSLATGMIGLAITMEEARMLSAPCQDLLQERKCCHLLL